MSKEKQDDLDELLWRLLKDDMLLLTKFLNKTDVKPGETKTYDCPFCGAAVQISRAKINKHIGWTCQKCGRGFGQ